MGSVSLKIGDGTARFRSATICSSFLHLAMLASVLATNLFALYAFTSSPPLSSNTTNNNLSLISDHVALILREIAASERRLHQIQRDLAGFDNFDPLKPSLSPELRLYLSRHPLPLGRDSRSGITELISSVSHLCSRSPDLLYQFTSYKPWFKCPNDFDIAAKLLSRGCDPLPRRRCRSFFLPSNSSNWSPRFGAQMWIRPRWKNDFLINDVLKLGGGRIRAALDVGGDGDFAAKMAEQNVTVVTTTTGRESAAAVSARGAFPLFLTPAARFPFYDSVFDLVHASKAIDEGAADRVRPEGMEFLMFDIDRVLRSGGLLWLDNYQCVNEERKKVLTRLIERFGYKKLKWAVGDKPGGGSAAAGTTVQVYLSAVLQKPARR